MNTISNRIKNFLIFASFFVSFLSASEQEEIRIEANMFEASEKQKVSIFTGNVRVRKGSDEINSSRMKIFFDDDNKPIKYELFKNVSFVITAENNSTYTGKTEKITLYPLEKKYIFSESVEITELETDRKIKGGEVLLNAKTGNVRILGSHTKPVVMIFKVNEE